MNKIPTINNGRVRNSDIQNPTKTKLKIPRAKPDKSTRCDRKVHMIGDSHLKESTIKNIQYHKTNFVVSNIIKTGVNIKQIRQSKEMEFKRLGKKEITVVNGGISITIVKKEKFFISHAEICLEICEYNFFNGGHPS